MLLVDGRQANARHYLSHMSFPDLPEVEVSSEAELWTWLSRNHAGESVLIVGHSNTVVPIVRALGGVTDFKYGHDHYHSIFVVVSNGTSAPS